jgi:putative lipoprotein
MTNPRINPRLLTGFILLLTMLTGCTTATISGDIYYRERIALPANATVIVTLEDVSRADTAATIISKREFTPETQVPIPFSLDYNRADINKLHRYALRAQIRSSDNDLLWATVEHYGVLTQDSPLDNVSLQLARADQTPVTHKSAGDASRLAYECDQLLALVIVDATEAVLHINGADLQLKQMTAASGARYANERAEFWSKGEEASITLDGETFTNCHNKPEQLPWAEAKARGIDFRATGNEPGWLLEIDADLQIEFVGNYGDYRVITPVPVPDLDSAQKSSYHAVTETHDLLITIESKPCQDSMSGMQFNQQVRILLDGNAYNGCGKSL